MTRAALRLEKRDRAEPRDALLLPSEDARALLALLARLSEPAPAVHRVLGGYLLVLVRPSASAPPRTIGLRALAPGLFLPADADLVPALLDDEARDVGRRRGLVFLPGGRVLAFDRERTVPISALLEAPALARPRFESFPAPPPVADRLLEVLREEEDGEDARILEAAAPPRAEGDPARPGLADRAAGRAELSLGNALAWLGRLFRSERLDRLGRRVRDGAFARWPALPGDLVAKQRAALEALLREFREGSIERALSRALPLGDPGDRAASLHPSAELPRQPPVWSLADVLSGLSRPASEWQGGGADLQRALAQEYRKAAAEAEKHGDFGRSAFIHGKLLRDLRAAAEALRRGGLHHDAAMLWLSQGDVAAAARDFEAAGEVDRALVLYREAKDHVSAGDLLARAGESDAAVEEYRRAAERLVSEGAGHRAAAALLLVRAGRPDLALAELETGWALRPARDAAACAAEQVPLLAKLERWAELRALSGDAAPFFSAPGGSAEAARFWNAVARAADAPGCSPALAAELRDRARLGVAAKLRQLAASEPRPARFVSELMAEARVWPPAVLADAAFALERAREKR